MSFRTLAILALAFLGMIDTLYLSLSRDSGPVECHITEGCGDVLTSVYSEVGGIPISWFGFAFYLFAFSVAAFSVSGVPGALGWLRWPSLAAFVTSVALTGVQAFVLQAYCEYCLTSAALSTLIFLLVWLPRRTESAATSQ